jgi:hypothetical protein
MGILFVQLENYQWNQNTKSGQFHTVKKISGNVSTVSHRCDGYSILWLLISLMLDDLLCGNLVVDD